MAKASDNAFPSVLLAEQGSAPTTPAAGHARGYVGADGLWRTVDDAGAVTAYGAGGASTLGVLGRALITTDHTGIGSPGSDITGLSVTVTVAASRLVRVSTFVRFLGSTTAMSGILQLKESTTTLAQGATAMPLTATAYGAFVPVLLTPSAGSHTYKSFAQRGTGSGTIDVDVDAVAPGFILVEDIGAA